MPVVSEYASTCINEFVNEQVNQFRDQLEQSVWKWIDVIGNPDVIVVTNRIVPVADLPSFAMATLLTQVYCVDKIDPVCDSTGRLFLKFGRHL